MSFIKSIFHLIKTIIFLLLLVGAIIFMVNNRDDAIIHLYPLPFEIQTKIFLVILISFILGIFFGFFLFSKKLVQKTFSNFISNHKIKKLEEKLELKNRN
jgi:flagellar biosynthesis protein FlhB